MNLNVYQVVHTNGLTFCVAASSGQLQINVLIGQFIEKQSEALCRLGNVPILGIQLVQCLLSQFMQL